MSELHLMEKISDSNMEDTDSPSQASWCLPYVVGFKKKADIRTKRHLKSCLELQVKKRKGDTTVKDSQVQQNTISKYDSI